MAYQGYNESGIVNIPDNKTGTKMLDKLSRIKDDRRKKPLDQMDNIVYPHRQAYGSFNLLIGDTYFAIPPEFIMVNSESTSQSIVTLRQENTQKEQSGYRKRTILIDLVFNGIEQLNGYKVKAPHIIKKNDNDKVIYDNEGYYYVDGLRQLLAQFKCAPILPISNELINGMYGIFNVALQSITISTIDGYPDAMTAQITLQEVCMFPYIEMPDICFRYMIDWDLFRYYYQTFLTENHMYKRLQSLPANKEHNRFIMSILDNSIFTEEKTNEYNILEVVCDRKIIRTDEKGNILDTNYITWIDSYHSDCIISSFQCGYQNILTNIQLSDMSSPTVQFLGGMDTVYNITIETTDYSVVQAIEQCQIANDMITRNNGKLRSSIGFVKLESELVEFTGSLFVMIESVSTNTVPGFPGLYNIQMNCISYDIAQSEREDLKGFLPFDCDKEGRCGKFSKTEDGKYGYVSDHKHSEQTIPNSITGLHRKAEQDNYAEWKLRTEVEVYPDLRLPKYSELNDAIKAIAKFRKKNKLSKLPYKTYPVQPTGMISGSPSKCGIKGTYSDEEKALMFAKDIDKSSLEYNVYADPDFYVFYPSSYVSFGEEEGFEYYDSVLTPPQRKGYVKTKITPSSFDTITTGGKNNNNNDDDSVDTGAPNALADKYVKMARDRIGDSYVWGSCKEGAYDCSGFVSFLLQKVGVYPKGKYTPTETLANMASGKNSEGKKYFKTVKHYPEGSKDTNKDREKILKKGDIIVRRSGGSGHVVIYAGGDEVIHASNPRQGVISSTLSTYSKFNVGSGDQWILRPKKFISNGSGKNNNSSKGGYDYLSKNKYGFHITEEFAHEVGEWEGFEPKTVATDGGKDIGYGFHNEYTYNGERVEVEYGMTMTEQEAAEIVIQELEGYIDDVIKNLEKNGWDPAEFTNDQICTLSSYLFNRGRNTTAALEIFKKSNSPTIEALGNNLPKYWGSKEEYKTGLINRRKKERAVYFGKLSKGKNKNSKDTSKKTNSEYVITKSEFESICRYIMAKTKGEKPKSEKAMAEVIYNRMTNGKGRFGGLTNILGNDDFEECYKGELNDTIENSVKDVFCNGKRTWTKFTAYKFLTSEDVKNNLSVKNMDKDYERPKKNQVIGTHAFWGSRRKPSDIKFEIVEDEEVGDNTPRNESESTSVNHEAYTLDDVDRFGECIIVRTEYTSQRKSKKHWQKTVNSTDNIFYTSFVNDYQYSARGRYVRAFPTYMLCILDDQAQWYDGQKLWTNYYINRSVVDISVHETNDMPTSTATIVINNSYHNLDRTQGGLSQYSIQGDKDYDALVKWFHKYTGMLIGCGPKLTSTLIELHQVIYDHARLREDARVCLRMGYGSDPLSLAPVINGHISDISLGNQISMVVTSDGHELVQYIMDSKSEKDGKNNGFLGLFGLGAKQESSNIIGNILCKRASWMHYLSSEWGEASKYGIEHFGLYNNQTMLSNFDTNGTIQNSIDAGQAIGQAIGDSKWYLSGPAASVYGGVAGYIIGSNIGIMKGEVSPVGGAARTVQDIWDEYSEQYDILKNIYRANYKKDTYHHTGGALGADEEQHVVFTDYNMTPWDVFQVCTQQVPEYIVKPSCHQFDSRLYFGLPFWIEKYRYDYINNMLHEECKSSTQVHYLCSLTNIINNQVRVTSKYSYTNIKVMYQRGSSAVTTQVIHSDDTIDSSRQKTRILDTPIVQDAFGPDLVYELIGYDVGEESARRTGISNLLYGWQQQYQGELICLGCPGIYAHDYLMLNDMFANMFGVCIVREVIHSFSVNTGFTTTIVPGMIGFSTDENSGLIETTQNYLMMAGLFASYSHQRRDLKNAYEANSQFFSNLENARQEMAVTYNDQTAVNKAGKVFNGVATGLEIAGLGAHIFSMAKCAKAAGSLAQNGKNFVKVCKGIADGYKAAKAAKQTFGAIKLVRNVTKTLKTIEALSSSLAPTTLGASLVITVICFVIDAILSEMFEWFSNKNVCTLLPLWWEEYPFVSGVKDGEKILLIKSNSTATPENTRDDAKQVESNDD